MRGIEIGFLKCFPLSFALNFEGIVWVYWHYSPSDRVEVAMYGRRSLVGLQQCRVSSQDEKRERIGCYGPLFVSTNHVLGIETLSSERSKFLVIIASKGHL